MKSGRKEEGRNVGRKGKGKGGKGRKVGIGKMGREGGRYDGGSKEGGKEGRIGGVDRMLCSCCFCWRGMSVDYFGAD